MLGWPVGDADGKAVGWPLGDVGIVVGWPLGDVGVDVGNAVGIAVVGAAVGIRQSGYTSGSSAGEFIGSKTKTSFNLHSSDGIWPPSELLCNAMDCKLLRPPRLDGMVPVSEFLSNVNVTIRLRSPRQDGIVCSALFR